MSDPICRLPGNRALGTTFGVALVLALLAQLNLQLTFRLVGHPVPLGAANLEPDPEVVRGWYALLIEQGTYLQMVRTELVDILWAILLGFAVVTLNRFVGGLLRNVHRPIASLLVRWAPLAAAGPAFDVVENIFSLAMLTDPFGFPAWWSFAHAAASWAKIVTAIAAPAIGLTLTGMALVIARGRRRAENAGKGLPSS